jgi:succinoglycan biosynthesis transport protein ExoP
MDATANLPGVGIKPLLSLKRHYRVSLVLFCLIPVLGLPVVWIKGKSVYSAEALFLVAPRYMKNLQSDPEVELQSNSQYREFVNQLQNTVTRYDVLERALGILAAQGIDTRPPALSPRRYIELLQRTLITRPVPDTYMVRVGLSGGAADRLHLHQIVNAVLTAFLDTVKTEQIYGSTERYQILRDEGIKLREEMNELDAKRAKLAQRLGLTTFSSGVANPFDALLAQLREKLTNAEVERKRADATYQAFRERRELPADLGRSLLEMRLGDLGLIGLRNETHKRIEELVQRVAGLAGKHPARAPAEAEIEELRERLQAAEDAFDRKSFDNYDARLAATLEQRQRVADGLRRNVETMASQASEFARLFQQALELTRGIDERGERIREIRQRLNFLETESNALGFVRLVTPALPADLPTGLGKTKLLLALIVAAFGAALAAPVALDMLDRRIRSVNEAEKLLGFSAAGWQIRREDLPTRLYAEEQSRRFAAALMRTRSRHGRNLFALTAVKARGGTTSTVLDTAATLTRLGARVLVVEANTFAPFAGFEGLRPGLSELLLEGLDPLAPVRTYEHQGIPLAVLGIGAAPPGGLQRIDRLRAALERWSAEYEYVLIDLPPILLSADAEMLVEVLGQVFLVVQAESVIKGEIIRAKRLLQKLDPEAVGLFVNDVPLFRGGGYMEQSIVEWLTHGRFHQFMTDSRLRLTWDMLRTRWLLARARATRKALARLRRNRRRVRETRDDAS